MKKWIVGFACVLLLAVLAGLWNRQDSSLTAPPTSGEIETAEGQESPVAETSPSGEAHVNKEYTEAGILIDAVCPVTQAKVLPTLTAQISHSRFDEMLVVFLDRYPQAQEIYPDFWWAEEPNGQALASFSLSELSQRGQISFSDYILDVNGSTIAPNGDMNRYGYFTEETLAGDEDQPFYLNEAMDCAIQYLSEYTDFDLTVYHALTETDPTTGRAWYRLGLQFSYLGTPISVASEWGNVDVDVGIGTQGIGHFSGCLAFSNVEETEDSQVMSLNEILDIFVEQGHTSLLAFGQQEGDRYEIYRIQPEYFVEFQQETGKCVFRPVWSFYYIYYSEDNPAYGLDCTLKLYADTGALCWAY